MIRRWPATSLYVHATPTWTMMRCMRFSTSATQLGQHGVHSGPYASFDNYTLMPHHDAVHLPTNSHNNRGGRGGGGGYRSQQQQQQPAAAETIDPTKNIQRYMFEVVYRSAFARERLREAIKEPSIEIALKHFDDFTRLHRYSSAGFSALVAGGPSGSDVGRLEIVLSAFAEWYYAMRAPQKVRMHEPWSWFPKARQMRRRFVFHAGPTNSGKTHEALEKLVAAKSGVYCAPLKALAAQVWRRIDAQVPCDLLIGDERQFGGSAEHVACTMEMTPVDFMVDVGVIDEIQMISDPERGWAWTRALLGLPAKEIHLCGEERALAIVERLLYQTFERNNLTVRRHQRLVGLQLTEPLGGHYAGVENGDCIVAFSRKKIFEIKERIERETSGSVAAHVIYGGLPFSVRESESAAFNQGVCDRYEADHPQTTTAASAAATLPCNTPIPPKKHVLVTTDAIAYGLNMNIRRIVFSTLRKFDGTGMVTLPQSTVLQVAGRAGRFGLRFSAEGGRVTTLFPNDIDYVGRAFDRPLPPIERAGLLPTADILTVYATIKEKQRSSNSNSSQGVATAELSFAELLGLFLAEISGPFEAAAASRGDDNGDMDGDNRGHKTGPPSRAATANELFFPCDMSRSVVAVASALDSVPADLLPLADRIVFCFCPLSDSGARSYALLRSYAQQHAELTSRLRSQAAAEAHLVVNSSDDTARRNNNASDEAPNQPLPTISNSDESPRVDIGIEQELGAVEDTLRATTVAANSGGAVLSSSLQQPQADEALRALEWMYRIVEVYGWLAWRFGNTFNDQTYTQPLKERIVRGLQEALRQQATATERPGDDRNVSRQTNRPPHSGAYNNARQSKPAPFQPRRLSDCGVASTCNSQPPNNTTDRYRRPGQAPHDQPSQSSPSSRRNPRRNTR